MTGFGNRNRVAQLTNDLTTAMDLHQASQEVAERAQSLADDTARDLALLKQLEDTTFEAIDVARCGRCFSTAASTECRACLPWVESESAGDHPTDR